MPARLGGIIPFETCSVTKDKWLVGHGGPPFGAHGDAEQEQQQESIAFSQREAGRRKQAGREGPGQMHMLTTQVEHASTIRRYSGAGLDRW